MKKSYIKFIVLIAVVLTAIGLIGQYKIIDRMTIKSMLKAYKQQLCTVSVDSESYAVFTNGDFENENIYMDTYKKYFTKEAYKDFYGNRWALLYIEFVKLNPEVSLQFKEIKYDKFIYDSENDRYIVNYTLQIQASDGQVYTEPNHTVVVKENGQWKIDHERIYNTARMLEN